MDSPARLIKALISPPNEFCSNHEAKENFLLSGALILDDI